MSQPTILGPWYIVQRPLFTAGATQTEYYQHSEEGEGLWTTEKKTVCIFMSLHSAARVADATVADVRVLWAAEHAKEFGRG